MVVSGPPSKGLRQALPQVSRMRFGIAIDYVGSRGNETAAKLGAERRAGAVSIDVMIAGIQTMATILHREKMLDPLKPALLLPEVVDGAKWKIGKLWFSDPEQIYILRLFNTLGTPFHINTDKVKPGELRSVRDLLDPKWKGKISVQDPTTPGSGSNHAAALYAQFGEEFVRRFYIDQKPAISRDTRQLTDWLARGTYPIALGAEDSESTGCMNRDCLSSRWRRSPTCRPWPSAGLARSRCSTRRRIQMPRGSLPTGWRRRKAANLASR